MSNFIADDVTLRSLENDRQLIRESNSPFFTIGSNALIAEFYDGTSPSSSMAGGQAYAGASIDVGEADSAVSQNVISGQALAAPWITIPRSQFQLDNFVIFYGTVEVPGGVPSQTVQSWDVDTIIVANRRAYNGLSNDTYYNQGGMNDLRTDTTQDVLAYVNVGKVDKNLETYTNASAADAWFGGQTFDGNGVSIPNVNFANYWAPTWLEKLKVEVNFAVAAGASGLFLDDVGVNFELQNLPGRTIGANSLDMMQLVIDLAAYARDPSRGGSEFRIMINGAPFIGNDSAFGTGGNPANLAVFNTYRNAIDAVLYENPFNGAILDTVAMNRFLSDFGAFGKQVVIVDNMKSVGLTDVVDGPRLLAEAAATYGFVPLLVASGPGGGNALSFTTPPFLTGLASNRPSIGSDIITGTPISDVIDGGAGDDKLYGQAGSDTLIGAAGNDTLIGGDNNDMMSGGIGNDYYYLNDSGDVIQEASGEGFDIAFTSVSYGLQATSSIEVLAASSPSSITGLVLIGSNFANQILGTAGNDTLIGGLGSDTLYGFGGNDNYAIDSTLDQIMEAAGGGIDSAFTSTSFTLGSNSEVEFLGAANTASTTGLALFGNSINNQLAGASGADTLFGGAGADTLYGFAGNDSFYVDNLGDVVVEAAGGGLDTIFTVGSYILAGTSEVEILAAANAASVVGLTLGGNEFNNQVLATAGNDTLSGNAGNDTLYGFGGNDVFTGGLGNDVFVGGAGSDTFVLGEQFGGATFDTVTDYLVADDQIQLNSAAFVGLGVGGLGASAFTIGASATTAAHRIIYNSATGTLSYDADGSGAGAAAIFANIGTGLAMTAGEFLVV